MAWFAFERRWLTVLWETVLPSGTAGGVPLGARDVPLDRFLDELIAFAPRRVTWGLRACVWLVTLCPPWVIGRVATFPRLDSSARLAVLEKLRDSDVYLLRELPTLFKMLGGLGFCGLPEVRSSMGIARRGAAPPAWLEARR